MSRISIIGFAGYIGAGKTLAASMVPGATHLQWSDAVDRGVAAILGIEEDELRDRRTKDGVIRVAGMDLSPRHLLQTLGTEWGRLNVCQDIWVNLTMERIRHVVERTGRTRFTICGTRFANEAQAIRSRGGEVWWVERPGLLPGEHVSDRVLTADQCDRVLRNEGTADDLRREVERAWLDYASNPGHSMVSLSGR
jgi:hypothetical protein